MIQFVTRDVEKIAAFVFEVPETDRLALRARLENLRKKGCPQGLATGRGKVARFDFEQLTDLAIALALIDAGFSPDHAVTAVEDIDNPVGEFFGVLAQQKLSPDQLTAALSKGEWPVRRSVTAWCYMHRLLSEPRDLGVPVATWILVHSSGVRQSANVPISAVCIDVGALFVKLANAMSYSTEFDAVEMAFSLLARAEQYVVNP